MEVKTEAVVLRSIKYGDSSLIVDMLTRERGRVSFIVRIPKTQKGKMKKQLFQPLTILSIVFNYQQKSSLQHLRDIRLARPFASIPFDARKMCIVMFLAEFLTYVTRDEQENGPLFEFIVSSLEWLDASSDGYANFHLVFMMRLTRFVGFLPNLEDYRDGFIFDLREGRFSGAVPLHHDYLKADDARRVALLMRMDFANMSRFRMNRDDRNRITDVVLTYYRLHVPAMPELKSFDVMKEVFS